MSRENLDYTADSYSNTSNPLRALMQGAYFSGIGFDMVSEDEDLEAFCKHKIIFCCGIRRVLPELLEKLNAFADNGGKIVIVRDFAVFDPPPGAEKFLSRKDIVRIDTISGDNMYPGKVIPRIFGGNSQQPARPNTIPALLCQEAELLRSLLPETPFIAKKPEHHLITVFKTLRKENTVVLHILNTKGILPPQDTLVSHDDIIEPFAPGAVKNPHPLVIVLNRGNFSAGKIYSPEFEGYKNAQITRTNHQTVITIPPDTAAGYMSVELS